MDFTSVAPFAKFAGTALLGEMQRKKDRSDAIYLARRQKRMNRNATRESLLYDMSYLVKGAQKAGFNPLTVLGATGGGANNVGVSMTPLSRDASMAQAAFGELFRDPLEVRRAELENELLEARIADVKDETARLGVQGVRSTSSPTRKAPQQRFLPNETNPFVMRPSETAFPVVDPGSTRPEDTRVTHGPYKGRYVLYSTDGVPFISPPNTSPAAVFEEINGGIMAEVAGGVSTIRKWTRAYVNERGELVAVRPKGRNEVRDPGSYSRGRNSRGGREPLRIDIF